MITNTGDFSSASLMALKGLSTDTKPTGTYHNTRIQNGSSFLEMDTGKVFMYDAENAEWLEL